MFLWASFVALLNVARLLQLGRAAFHAVYWPLNAACGLALYAFPRKGGVTFAALIAAILASDALTRRRLRTRLDTRWLLLALATFAGSFGIWLLDQNQLLSTPESLFQGHGFWHCGAAAATGWLYLYYHSERDVMADERSVES